MHSQSDFGCMCKRFFYGVRILASQGLHGKRISVYFHFFQSGLKSLRCSSRFPDWRHARPGVHSKIALMAKLGKSERTGGMFKAANTVAGWYLFLFSLYAPRSHFQKKSGVSRHWLVLKSPLCVVWSDHKFFKRSQQLLVSCACWRKCDKEQLHLCRWFPFHLQL